MRTTHALRSLVVGALVLTGCSKEDTNVTAKTSGDPSSAEDSNSEGGATNETTVVGTTGDVTSGATETGGVTTGVGVTESPTSDPQTGGTDSSGCGFICDTTGDPGGVKECDIWAQDCPETEKCMPYADNGESSWNATKCTPLDANPGQPGDECMADGGGVSGVDNCAVGSMCWFLDANDVGTCAPMCTGSEDAPMCDNGKTCDVSNDGVIIICLDTCNPLMQDCPDGQICFFDGVDTFICDFDASGEEGQYGDPCAFINVCDPGLWCSDQATVPGCPNADGCCSPFCNVNEPNTCPGAPMQECVAWYEEGAAPPGQEDIGLCAVPI